MAASTSSPGRPSAATAASWFAKQNHGLRSSPLQRGSRPALSASASKQSVVSRSASSGWRTVRPVIAIWPRNRARPTSVESTSVRSAAMESTTSAPTESPGRTAPGSNRIPGRPSATAGPPSTSPTGGPFSQPATAAASSQPATATLRRPLRPARRPAPPPALTVRSILVRPPDQDPGKRHRRPRPVGPSARFQVSWRPVGPQRPRRHGATIGGSQGVEGVRNPFTV